MDYNSSWGQKIESDSWMIMSNFYDAFCTMQLCTCTYCESYVYVEKGSVCVIDCMHFIHSCVHVCMCLCVYAHVVHLILLLTKMLLQLQQVLDVTTILIYFCACYDKYYSTQHLVEASACSLLSSLFYTCSLEWYSPLQARHYE